MSVEVVLLTDRRTEADKSITSLGRAELNTNTDFKWTNKPIQNIAILRIVTALCSSARRKVTSLAVLIVDDITERIFLSSSGFFAGNL